MMGLWLLPVAVFPASSGALAQANLLPNPSFELVEPPPPTPAEAASGAPAPAEHWLPRTWNVWADGEAAWQCPDDPLQARTGRRCLHAQASRGACYLRYGPMPVPSDLPWTVEVQCHGHGRVVAGAIKAAKTRWVRLPEESVLDLADQWQALQLDFPPPTECREWLLEVATRGPTEAWIDDASVTYPGLQPLGLPPDHALTRDEHTLVYLPFEEPLNEDAFFVKPEVALLEPGEGRFGRGLRFGPEGYVACSADEHLNARSGTVEVWVKTLFPGNDGVSHNLVGVPGPEGMVLCKDQYGHVAFGFSSGWVPLGHIYADGYANSWQPGVWRHLAACWDEQLMQLFVDGKLIAWAHAPRLSRALGPELAIGSPGLEVDDLRISDCVRYRLPVPPAEAPARSG